MDQGGGFRDGQGVEIDSATHLQQMKQQLRGFWMEQMAEMERLEVGSEQGQ
jgi:hypothetical protein